MLRFGGANAASTSVFPLGVASGDPSSDGMVLWTRLALDPLAADGQGGMAGPVPVRWEVAEDETFSRIAISGETVAEAVSAHSVHVETAGLRPGRPYWYRFTAQGQRSPVGLTRTAPAPNARADRLRLAIASCSNWERGYFSAYRHMAEERPDLTLFLGDYIYEYSLGAQRSAEVVRPYGLEEANSLAGYRNRYALHRTDPDLQALHAAAPCLAIWDDHEVQDAGPVSDRLPGAARCGLPGLLRGHARAPVGPLEPPVSTGPLGASGRASHAGRPSAPLAPALS